MTTCFSRRAGRVQLLHERPDIGRTVVLRTDNLRWPLLRPQDACSWQTGRLWSNCTRPARLSVCVLFATLTLAALPAFAQSPAKLLTPPDVLGKAKTIQFTATLLKERKTVEVSKAVFVQPNKAYIVDTDSKTKAIDAVYVSDGKTQTEYQAVSGRYIQSDAASSIGEMDSHDLASFALSDFLSPAAFAKFKDVGNDIQGKNQMYGLSLGKQNGKEASEFVCVSHKSGLPLYISFSREGDVPVPNEYGGGTHFEGQETERIVFSHWKLNAPIADSQFAYTPPAGAKLYVAPKLLADGTTAPDFTVSDKDGKPVKLSDYRGKTVVLDFWATWCGPCQSSLPHTTAVAKKYADKNVVVLAVNVWDTPKAFQEWLPKHPEYAPLNFAVDTNADQSKSVATALYGVSGIPTQYVIDPSGKIIKSIVGYEEGDMQLEDALKAVGS